MKHTLSILFISLITIMCYGQNSHLEPVDLEKYDGVLKVYYDNVFPLLYKEFPEKPLARYTSMPSFSEEYSFCIEQKFDKYFIISNNLSSNYWYEKNKAKVKVLTKSTEIDLNLYNSIITLFKLLEKQTKKPDGMMMGNDGTIYYFATTNNHGEIKIGKTWSPDDKSLLGRLVKICDDLYSTDEGDKLPLSKINEKIIRLISDLEK